MKDYGTVVAVRDVSFRVGQGEVVGFLGPNAAGKTTTLRILAGFLGATSGRVRIAGVDIAERSLQARAGMGYMPEAVPLYPELRVREYLWFRARLKRVTRGDGKRAVERVLELAAIGDVADTLIGHLSKGYRQRVGLADALLGKPPLLILDEPTSGLDPNQIRDVRTVIRDLRKEHTILLSTHILSEVETTCDRAIVINRGVVVAEGSLDELRARRASRAVRLVLRDADGRAEGLLTALPSLERLHVTLRDGDLLQLDVHFKSDAGEIGTELEQLLGMLITHGIGVREARPLKATLEDVFAQLTQPEAGS